MGKRDGEHGSRALLTLLFSYPLSWAGCALWEGIMQHAPRCAGAVLICFRTWARTPSLYVT